MIVAEVPQSGHATYIFAKAGDVREFVNTYATTKQRRYSQEPGQRGATGLKVLLDETVPFESLKGGRCGEAPDLLPELQPLSDP